MDKRMLLAGIATLAVGTVLTASIGASMPIGHAGMTAEEAADLIMAQQETEHYTALSGVLIGVGFLLVLISFGARRRGSSVKREKAGRIDAD